MEKRGRFWRGWHANLYLIFPIELWKDVEYVALIWLKWQSRMSSDFLITKNCNTNNWQRSKLLCPDSLNWNFNEQQGETGPSEKNAENRDAYLQKDKPDLSQAEGMEWRHKREMLQKTAW